MILVTWQTCDSLLYKQPLMTESHSASPEPHRSSTKSRKRERSRDRSRDRSEKSVIPHGVQPINEEDYFLKSAEFGRWLRIEKRKVSASNLGQLVPHDIVMCSISMSLVQTSRAGVPCPRMTKRIAPLINYYSYFRKFVKVCVSYELYNLSSWSIWWQAWNRGKLPGRR